MLRIRTGEEGADASDESVGPVGPVRPALPDPQQSHHRFASPPEIGDAVSIDRPLAHSSGATHSGRLQHVF